MSLPSVYDCTQSSPCLPETEWHCAKLVDFMRGKHDAAPTAHARLHAQYKHATRCLGGSALELSVMCQVVLHLRMGKQHDKQRRSQTRDNVWRLSNEEMVKVKPQSWAGQHTRSRMDLDADA